MNVRDVVAEIAASIPKHTHGNRPWWERVDPKHHELLQAIHSGWHAGTFGTAKMTAARRISAKLREFDIVIGEQGVLAWLELPQKS